MRLARACTTHAHTRHTSHAHTLSRAYSAGAANVNQSYGVLVAAAESKARAEGEDVVAAKLAAVTKKSEAYMSRPCLLIGTQPHDREAKCYKCYPPA